MARKYNIGLTTEISDFANAIADYYGEGNYTIHYQSSEYLVFRIPAISNKVLRIRIIFNKAGGNFYCGDEWTSDASITNGVAVFEYFTAMTSNAYLVLSQYALQYYHSDSQSALVIIGQLSNGEYAGIGLQNSSSNVTARAFPRLMTDNRYIVPMLPSISNNGSLTETSNKLLTFPMYILDTSSGNLLADAEGNPVYMKDIRVCRYNSILDNDNIFNYYQACYYNTYVTYGVSTVGFFSEIDNYTL